MFPPHPSCECIIIWKVKTNGLFVVSAHDAVTVAMWRTRDQPLSPGWGPITVIQGHILLLKRSLSVALLLALTQRHAHSDIFRMPEQLKALV